VTVLGSNFIVGDAASLPAINSLLDAIARASQATAGGIVTPTKVFLESAHDDDRELPVGTAEVTCVDRKKAGEALVEAIGASAFDAAATSAGWRVTTAPPAQWPRSSARTTRFRASRSRPRRTGWHDPQRRRDHRQHELLDHEALVGVVVTGEHQ
jgi:hypothetical protein